MYGTNFFICFVGGRIDESNPQKGVVVKMFSSKCSISVSVLCDSIVAQVSRFLHLQLLELYVYFVSLSPLFYLSTLFSRSQVPGKFVISGDCDYVGTQNLQ